MSTCENCKFFFAGYYTWDFGKCVEPTDTAEMRRVPNDPDSHFGQCENLKLHSDCTGGWIHGTEDGEGYRGRDGLRATCDEHRGFLEVGPDFGCIHWQENPRHGPAEEKRMEVKR